MIECIIPTVSGREASLERLLDSLQRTMVEPYDTIIVRDSITCGWGWKTGLERSHGPYVALLCDDQEILQPGWDSICIETVERDLLPCPRVYFPDGAPESRGGDMNSMHHISITHKKDGAPVDYTTIPFCSREQIEAIGMIPTQYSSDVWVSYRGRQLGIETVLRHGWEVRHWHEQAHRGAGMSQNERDAVDEKTMREELARMEGEAVLVPVTTEDLEASQ